MRTVALSLALFTLASFELGSAHAEIPWQTNLRTAHVQAQAEGKLLLLHFYTDHCVWCDRLEAGAFQTPEVGEAVRQNYIPVKVHAAENPKLAKMFEVAKFPTDVVVTTRGETLSHSVSPQDPSRYVAMLGEAAAAYTPDGATRVASAPAQPPTAGSATQAGARLAGAAAPAADAVSPQSVSPQSGAMDPAGTSAPQPNRYASGQAHAAAAQARISAPTTAPASETPAAANAPTLPDSFRGGASGQLAGTKNRAMTLGMPGRTAADSPATSATPSTASVDEPVAATAPNQAPAASDPTENAAQENSPELAMQGFCPVTVIEEDRWVEGDPELGVIHLGKLYLFANEKSREIFLDDPIPYTPVLNEIDVVRFFEERRIVPGKREWGLKDPTHNRMFFFADEAAMNHFWNEHARYTDASIEVMEKAIRDANPGS